MVFLAFTLLTPYFSFIPKPTLSAVIICAVIFMIEVVMTKQIWTINSKYNKIKKKCLRKQEGFFRKLPPHLNKLP